MKNCRPCLTALSLFWFLWDIKEPTLLFVKCRGCKPRWCGTTVKWAGWKMNWDASLVSFPVTVLSHRGQFNKELEVYSNAWPSRSGFHHHHHHVSSRQYERKGLHAVWPTLSVLSNHLGYFPALQPHFVSLFLNCLSLGGYYGAYWPLDFQLALSQEHQ